MSAFLISQIIGLCLFFTLNYGLYSYIQYRKNQVAGKKEHRAQWFLLQNARVAVYTFFIFGVLSRLALIEQNLNIDYSHYILGMLYVNPELPLSLI